MIFLLYSGTSVLIIYISNIQRTKKYSYVILKCWLLQDYCELRSHVKVLLPEKLIIFAWLVWYLTWLTTHCWKWSGVRFMRAPTKPCGVGKIDWKELEAGTSPSCGSPGVRLFWSFVLVMSFGRRWEISCLLWWLFKFTTKILNINSNSCQATLPRCFPPSVQLDR